MENTQWVKLEKINYGLVVLKPYIMCELFQPFSQKLILLLFKYVWYIELLKFFVGKIDKKLLQWIYFQNLETKDIEQPNAFPKWFVSLL